MVKFFREYARILMVVLGAVLILIFLVGDIFSRGARQAREAAMQIGRSATGPVSTDDLQRAQRDAQMLAEIGFTRMASRDALVNHLLAEEAAQAGIHVARAQVLELLSGAGVTGEQVDAARRRHNLSLDGFYDTIARHLAADLHFQVQATAITASTPRVQAMWRDRNQTVPVNFSVIDSQGFVDRVPEPTEEELQAFFEECRNRPTEHTESELRFGYLQPAKVQIEYLTIPPSEIVSKIRISEAQAQRHYEENRQKYFKRVPRPPATQPLSSEEPQFDRVPQTYEEVRDRVREEVRLLEAQKAAQRVMERIHDDARRAWNVMPVGEDGFRTPPPADKTPSFEALRDQYSKELPVTLVKTDLADQRALQSARVLPSAVISHNGRQMLALPVAFRVKGLVNPGENDPQPVLNLMETAPSVAYEFQFDPRTQSVRPTQYYVFRVVQAQASGPPQSLADVRTQVIEDWKLMKAHAMAGEAARKLAEVARTVGLAKAVENATELKSILAGPDANVASQPNPARARSLTFLEPKATPGAFTRAPRIIPGVGPEPLPELTEKVFETAAQPLSEGASHRIVVSPAAKAFKWVLGEVGELAPLYEGEFQQQREMLAMQTAFQAQQAFEQAWFNPENIYKRTGFVGNANIQPF